MSDQVRIVVGEGRAMRRGLLRFVLEGEGYQVVAEATNAAELGRVLAVHRPDLVVLDDGIGAMAVGMTREMVPAAKIVLVWPRDVVPVGGDARVDPSDVLRELGPAVARVATPLAADGTTTELPAWIERVRKDRSALRERLAKATGAAAGMTALQRRGQRLHPVGSAGDQESADTSTGDAEPIIDDTGHAPVVILPTGDKSTVSAGAGTGAPDADEDEKDRSAAGVVIPIAAAGATAAGIAAAGSAAASETAAGGEAAGAAGTASTPKTASGTGTAVAAGAGGAAAVAAGTAAAAGTGWGKRAVVALVGTAAAAVFTFSIVNNNNRLPTHAQGPGTTQTSVPTSPGTPPTSPPPTKPGDNGNGDGNNHNGGGNPDGHHHHHYPPVPRYARAARHGR